ncbi:MAG: hypothetical protein ACR2QC_01550 [Gammaproteobacteria bacterium]
MPVNAGAGQYVYLRRVEPEAKTQELITATPHGLAPTSLAPAYIDRADGLPKLAQANAVETLKEIYIVGVPSPTTVLYVVSGLLTFPGHGLTIGGTYLLTDVAPGSFVESVSGIGTPPQIIQHCLSVTDADHVVLHNQIPHQASGTVTTVTTVVDEWIDLVDTASVIQPSQLVASNAAGTQLTFFDQINGGSF